MSTHASAHLHVHSEYSLLDGAANIDGLAARAAAFGQPALGLTDHGVMNGERRALQGVQEARHQADPRPRGVLRRRPHGPRGQDRAQPPDAPRRLRRGLQEPHQALQRRLPRGPVPRQAGRRPPPARAPRRGRHRAQRLPRLPQLPPHRRGPHRRRRARTSTTSSRSSAPRTSTSRSSATASPSRSRSTRQIAEVRAGDGPLARRHRRRALPPQGGLPPPRGAAVRADEVDARAAEDELRHQRVLFEELGGDGGVLQRHAGGAGQHARDRRALRHHDRAQAAADPALRLPRRPERGAVPRAARRRRPAQALRRPDPRRRAGARRHGARASSATWASTPTS